MNETIESKVRGRTNDMKRSPDWSTRTIGGHCVEPQNQLRDRSTPASISSSNPIHCRSQETMEQLSLCGAASYCSWPTEKAKHTSFAATSHADNILEQLISARVAWRQSWLVETTKWQRPAQRECPISMLSQLLAISWPSTMAWRRHQEEVHTVSRHRLLSKFLNSDSTRSAIFCRWHAPSPLQEWCVCWTHHQLRTSSYWRTHQRWGMTRIDTGAPKRVL